MWGPREPRGDPEKHGPKKQCPSSHNQAHFQPKAPAAVGMATRPAWAAAFAPLCIPKQPRQHRQDGTRPGIDKTRVEVNQDEVGCHRKHTRQHNQRSLARREDMAQVHTHARPGNAVLHTLTLTITLGLVESTPPPRRLLLVGGGHAHMQVLKDFQRQPPPNCSITLLVDRREAIYSGMVPGFVAGQFEASQLTFDLQAWTTALGAKLQLGRAVGFDPSKQHVELADGNTLPYDLCSWNIGSTVAHIDTPGVTDFALATRPIGAFVADVIPRLQEAITARADDTLRILVVGGGAAGVELAFCLQHRARLEGAKKLETTLLFAGPHPLPHSPASLRRTVQREAVRRSIRCISGERVIAVQHQYVETASNRQIPIDLCVWATGASAQLKSGWLPVRPTLQHVEYDNFFAVGDCAELRYKPQTPKAGVYAVRQGPLLAHNLRAYLAAAKLKQYDPQNDFLTLLNFGDGTAAGSKWGLAAHGKWLQNWKTRIDLRFMHRFQFRTKR